MVERIVERMVEEREELADAKKYLGANFFFVGDGTIYSTVKVLVETSILNKKRETTSNKGQ